MDMDYILFSRQFFEATGIYVNLLLNGEVIYSSFGEEIALQPQARWEVYPADRNPEFSSINPDLEHGHVHIEGTGYDLFLGPVLTAPVTPELIREFFEETQLPAAYREEAAEILSHMPIRSHPQFIRYLCFLHLCLNHKEARVDDLYREAENSRSSRHQRAADSWVEAGENESSLSHLDYEEQLYHLISRGDQGNLKRFLEKNRNFAESELKARTPLRHAKNSFIALAAKAGTLGAVRGGADPERIARLTDQYILECEQLRTLDEVRRLRYILLMDLCQRAGEAALPQGASMEIRRCLAFIRASNNRRISVEDVAGVIHRSASYVTRRFKEELGLSVSDYITASKMEEALDLLQYSDLSLSQISAYLDYSSQSYFQNVFKKHYGYTPASARKGAGH